MTVEELAGYLKLAAQTIRRYVLNREIPYQKIRKVIRFRLSEIERWVDAGGLAAVYGAEPDKSGLFTEPGVGDLFTETENGGEAHGGEIHDGEAR